jgi:hypothetical protein
MLTTPTTTTIQYSSPTDDVFKNGKKMIFKNKDLFLLSRNDIKPVAFWWFRWITASSSSAACTTCIYQQYK